MKKVIAEDILCENHFIVEVLKETEKVLIGKPIRQTNLRLKVNKYSRTVTFLRQTVDGEYFTQSRQLIDVKGSRTQKWIKNQN